MKVQETKKATHHVGGLSSSSGISLDKLEVTVIPVDDEPYNKVITIPCSMMGKYFTIQ